jgi:hypothetical protein
MDSTVESLLRGNREEILRLARTHGARNVRVFGSAARGEDNADSDLNLLVDMEEGRSLLDHWRSNRILRTSWDERSTS